MIKQRWVGPVVGISIFLACFGVALGATVFQLTRQVPSTMTFRAVEVLPDENMGLYHDLEATQPVADLEFEVLELQDPLVGRTVRPVRIYVRNESDIDLHLIEPSCEQVTSSEGRVLGYMEPKLYDLEGDFRGILCDRGDFPLGPNEMIAVELTISSIAEDLPSEQYTFSVVFGAVSEEVVPPAPEPGPEPPAPAPTATPIPAPVEPTAIPMPTATPTPSPIPPGPIEPIVDTLMVAIAPRFESNVPWLLPTSHLIQLRPALEHLIGVDRANGEYRPQLASSWAVSEDGSTWIFNLQNGVEFHGEGGQFSSDDVRHSLDMIMTGDSRSKNAEFWRENVEAVEAIDSFTVRLDFQWPEPELVEYLSANQDLVMLSKEKWDNGGLEGYESGVVGTGPYEFAERNFGQSIDYTRREDHWRRTPDFPGLTLLFVGDKATRLAMMQAGQVHIAELSRDMHNHAESSGLRVVSSRLPGIQVAWFIGGQYHPDGPNAPFDSVLVRQAMNLAIDRNAINESLFRGRGELMSVFGFHESLIGWDGWNPYQFDPARARALLAESGYPNGFDLTMYTSSLNSLPEMGDLTGHIAEYLSGIGIDVNIEEIDYPALRELYFNRQMHGALWGLAATRLQPRETIGIFNVSSGSVHSFEHPEIEELYALLQDERGLEERIDFLRGISRIKYDQYGEIPLLWLPADFVVNPNIVADYVFPGSVRGFLSHLEYVVPVPK